MAVVLIIGASRGIGLQAVTAALDAGHTVRAFARTADRIPGTHPKLTRVVGDALDPAALGEALAGVDAVIQTLGIAARPERAIKRTTLFSSATRALIGAMKEAGVRRLITVTGLGAGNSRGRGGLLYNTAFKILLGRVYDDKDVQEELIQESGLDWVIARPGILTDGPGTGRYRVLTDPANWASGFIPRADVADFVVKQIDDDTHLGTTPVLIR